MQASPFQPERVQANTFLPEWVKANAFLASRRHLRTDLALCIQGGIQEEISPFGLNEAFKDLFEFKEALKKGSRRHLRTDLALCIQGDIQGEISPFGLKEAFKEGSPLWLQGGI